MKLRKKVDKILSVFLVFIMAILVLDVLWQVASRYLLNSPSSFTDELAGFLLIWVGLFGAAYGTGTKIHLAIDLLPSKLSFDRRKYLEVIINSLIAIFALVVFVIGGTWLVYTRFYLGQVSAALEIPMGYVYLVLPVSGLLIIFYAVSNTLLFFEDRKLEKG
ncbi:MAG: TRAP transporter small permease [Bacteroidetes bacterium]|nr:TRAP transporter small permease [Bacteroidota bacterium]